MARTGRTTRKHREHKPHELGPRIFARGRYLACDLRPWGGGKPTLRNPKAPGWPERGERLEDTPENRKLARPWSWAYVEREREGLRERLTSRPAGRALGEAIHAYLAHRERSRSANTVANNRSVLAVLEAAVGSSRPVGRVSTADLQAIIDARVSQGYRPNTLHNLKSVWGRFFGWAEVEPNPARKLVVPPVPQREIRAFSEEDLVRLRAAADALDRERRGPAVARLLLEVGLATGARASELRALRWEDFDPESETVRIHRQQGAGGERATKSRRGRTALVLPPFWTAWYRPGNRPGAGYVLAGAKGRPLSGTATRYLMGRIADRAGVKGSLHDLRRTYGRRFLLAGGTLDQLKHALGHRSIRTTESQYAAVRDEDVMQAARARMGGGPRLHR